MSEAKSVSLFLKEGSSDKTYQVQLSPSGTGWIVTYQNGRRGGTLKSGQKTAEPLGYNEALGVYEKLVKSKTSKGYTEQENGVAFSSTEHAGRTTTFRPQLLNPLTRPEGIGFNSQWLAQEKHDGERRGVIMSPENGLIFANRKGLQVGVQEPIVNAINAIADMLPGSFSLDCEDMGDHLVIFDVPEMKGQPIDASFSCRAHTMHWLQLVLDTCDKAVQDAIVIDHPMAFADFKIKRLPEIEARGGEGYVLKNPNAPYGAGRPASGGDAFKVKFTESATCRVSGRNGDRRSVAVELASDSGEWISVGNVTIPVNAKIPDAGAFIEVEYLYAYKGGSLFQPVYRGQRNDMDVTSCTMSQLKFKTDKESLDERRYAAAEAAFENETFGGMKVAAVNGWANNGAGRFDRTVFLDVGEEDSKAISYAVEFMDGSDEILHVECNLPENTAKDEPGL